MVVGMIVMPMMVVVAARQQEGAEDIHAKPNDGNQGRLAEGNLYGLEQPKDRFNPDPQGDQAQHQRRGEARQVADLACSEAEPPVRCMLLGIGISNRCDTQRASMRCHMEAIGQQRHRSGDIAGENLADHHHSRQHHHPQRPTSVVVVRGPQIHMVVHKGVNIAGRRHDLSLISRSGV